MKKIFFFAAAVVAMAACQKGAQPAPDQPQVEITAPAEEGEAQEINLGTNLKSTVETKAQGSVDSWNATQKLYIYGFERTAQGLDFAAPKINNVAADSPAQQVNAEGEAVTTLNGALKVTDATGQPYYYEGNKTYDFFGYYVDDLQVTPQVAADGIFVPVTLTGGEDVMVAFADPAEDAKGTAIESTPRYAYSAYAARRDVHPTLKFEHQLVQFTFNIQSGSEEAQEKNLKVTSLTLDALNAGDLYVAGNDLGFRNVSATASTLNLFGFEGYNVPSKNDNKEPVSVGNSIMVIPNNVNGPLAADDTYKGKLYLTQEAMTEPTPLEFSLEFSKVQNLPLDDNGAPAISAFEAGYSFDITIIVYSLEDIDISAELTEWKEGGKVDIDTDVAPEIY